MIKYIIIAILFTASAFCFFTYNLLKDTTYDKSNILKFERRDDIVFFRTMAETMYYPSAVEFRIIDSTSVEVKIRRSSLHSASKLKNKKVEKITRKGNLIIIHTLLNNKDGSYSVIIPEDLKDYDLKLN